MEHSKSQSFAGDAGTPRKGLTFGHPNSSVAGRPTSGRPDARSGRVQDRGGVYVYDLRHGGGGEDVERMERAGRGAVEPWLGAGCCRVGPFLGHGVIGSV